jgi:hypothetical protein
MDKKDLLRIVKNKDNEIKIDESGKLDGRGAYICVNTECLEKAIKTKKLEKNLGVKLSEEFYENLRDIILKRQESKKVGGEVIG